MKNHALLTEEGTYACLGFHFDTEGISHARKKKFEILFGFEPGERWFGIVVCEGPEDDEHVQHGELTLISKRTPPTQKVIIDNLLRQITLVDNPSIGPITYSVGRGCACLCASGKSSLLEALWNRQLCGLRSRLWHGNMTLYL